MLIRAHYFILILIKVLVVNVPAGSDVGGPESVYRTMPILINASGITLRLEPNTRVLAICDIANFQLVG